MKKLQRINRLLWVQGLYFLLPGIWPLVHMPSFLAVSGPKIDIWLVETVGLLLSVIGVALLVAAYRKEYVPSLAVLAISSSFALTWIDVYYTVNDRIWDIYLLDAGAEVALIGAWILVLCKQD